MTTLYDLIKSGKAPTPQCALTLGSEITHYCPEKMEITCEFDGKEVFTNPSGGIQGGFLCAMLDDAMAPALVFGLPVGHYAPTLELRTQFVRPAKVGKITGHGRVVSKGKKIAFLEGELVQDGKLIAKGSATAMLVEPK